MYAVVKTGGKQYKVSPNNEILVGKLNAEEGSNVELAEIMAFHNDKELISNPSDLTKISVSAQVIKNGKLRKTTIFTYKSKKNEKRKMGYRQPYTKLKILSINGI